MRFPILSNIEVKDWKCLQVFLLQKETHSVNYSSYQNLFSLVFKIPSAFVEFEVQTIRMRVVMVAIADQFYRF